MTLTLAIFVMGDFGLLIKLKFYNHIILFVGQKLWALSLNWDWLVQNLYPNFSAINLIYKIKLLLLTYPLRSLIFVRKLKIYSKYKITIEVERFINTNTKNLT